MLFSLVTSLYMMVASVPTVSASSVGQQSSLPSQSDFYNITTYAPTSTYQITTTRAPHPPCPSNAQCDRLEPHCLAEVKPCEVSCVYGETAKMNVTVVDDVPCLGNRSHSRNVTCRFCYQMPEEDYVCSTNTSCKSIGNYSTRLYRATCRVKSHVVCLGKRTFYKNKLCFWTNGYSWSTTMLLSITLGGFGVDRFYLGHWKEGIGKLFSFGGLGVWTIIDVILISIGYISPGDGSVYTYRTNFTSDYYDTDVYSLN